MGKANKLKNLDLSSVDFVPRGANQDSDIAFFKSLDGLDEAEPVKKSFFNRLSSAISKALSLEMDDMEPDELERLNTVYKSNSATDAERIEKAQDTMYSYTGALEESFSSILKDNTLHEEEQQELLLKSLEEFTQTVKGDIVKSFIPNPPKLDEKTPKTPKKESEEVNEMKIDKSLLTPEEAAAFDALIAKATAKVDPAKKEDGPEDEKKPAFIVEEEDDDTEESMDKACLPKKTKKAKEEETMKKSMDSLPPEIKKAYEDMISLTKSMEMKGFEDIAKKYEPLGYDNKKLAETMYELKKSNESHYDDYVEILEKSLTALNNSGMFGEIGKSFGGVSVPVGKSAAVTKIEAIAKGIIEADKSQTYSSAMAKAWEDNPEIAMEYENEKGGTR